MMRPAWVIGIAVWLIHAPAAHGVNLAQSAAAPLRRARLMWYRQPAQRWADGLPLGNGQIGAVVFGGVAHERIALNESTFWSGRPHDYNNPEALTYFPRIRDLVFAGKFQEAEKMVDEHFYGVPAAQQAYQPLGDLLLSFEGSGEAADYRRELDIQAGIADGKLVFLSSSPTMDVAIIRELFPRCIAASRLLGVDDDFRAKLEASLTRLPPYQINRRGYLQEWVEDWAPGNQGHNVSPNFTFYPGSSITLRGTPPLAAAIASWMEMRCPRGGWPTAWDIAVWARLERGDKVAACMRAIVRNSLSPSLRNTGPDQIDCNFGYTAGVAEALLQSHAGEISVLPALPAGWTDGSVRGLRARGGLDVSMQWKAGKLAAAQICGASTGRWQVRSGAKTVTVSLQAGQPLNLNADLVAADEVRAPR